MKNKKNSAFSISKYTYHEVLMESQLQSVGVQQSRLIEKYKMNNKSIKQQANVMKFVFGILLALLSLFPLIGYFQIFKSMRNTQILSETIFFITNFVLGAYFLMSILYILMAGLFSTGSLMTGNVFKMLQVLPLSKKELKKVAVMSLFRSVDVALILIMLGFPIVQFIISQNLFVFFSSLVVSILNSLFGFCILILIGRKISQIFSNENQSSKRANIIRVVTIIGYMILAFGTFYMIQGVLSLIEYLFEIFSGNSPPMILNIILSLIPLPITQGYIISLGMYADYFSFELLISSIIGISLFALLIWSMYRKYISSLYDITMTEIKGKNKAPIMMKDKKESQVEIKIKSPKMSFIRKDIISASHDIQTLMLIIMSIIYPIILIIPIQGTLSTEGIYTEFNIIPWILIIGVFNLNSLTLIIGLLNMEESGASVIASLPILSRDQAQAKLLLIIVIQLISLTIFSIINLILTKSLILFLLTISSYPIFISFVLLTFELKVYFFGKTSFKYILEELNKEHKVENWVLIMAFEIGFLLLIIILGFILYSIFGILGIILISLSVGIVGLMIFGFIFTRMFPKIDKIDEYKTGGFIRNNPIIGSVLLPILYILFLLFSLIVEMVLTPLLLLDFNLNIVLVLFFQFLLQFSFLALGWLLIIPLGLKLPCGQKTLKEYLKAIKLSFKNFLLRNILIGIISFGIFILIVLVGAIILGNYIFDLNVIFGTPSGISIGWFIFILMLIPGIWEEVAFRGVMIPLLLKKNKRNKTILISSLIFGLTHSFNLTTGLKYSDNFLLDPNFLVLCQVIYTSFMGITFAYIYIKTNSLLPGIILHYLINSVGQLFLNVTFSNSISSTIFLIGFIGVIPSVLIILFINLIFKKKNKESRIKLIVLKNI